MYSSLFICLTLTLTKANAYIVIERSSWLFTLCNRTEATRRCKSLHKFSIIIPLLEFHKDWLQAPQNNVDPKQQLIRLCQGSQFKLHQHVNHSDLYLKSRKSLARTASRTCKKVDCQFIYLYSVQSSFYQQRTEDMQTCVSLRYSPAESDQDRISLGPETDPHPDGDRKFADELACL